MGKLRVLLVVLLVSAPVLFASDRAFANHVSCGQLLTQSTMLDSDLYCQSGDGVQIGADNIVFDLNGHSITGPYSTCCGVAVHFLTHSGVTVQNGTINHFGEGVGIYGGQGNTVKSMSIFADGTGIDIQHSQSNLIQSNLVQGAQFHEIQVCCQTQSASGGNQVLNNALRGRSEAIHFLTPSNTAAGNVVLGGAISVANASGNMVHDNSIYNVPGKYPLNGGVFLYRFANNNVIERNYVKGAIYAGIYAYGGGLVSNVIRNNRLVQGQIGVQFVGDPVRPSSDNQVIGNVATSNAGDGILIPTDVGSVLVQGNYVTRSGDDGIDVDGSATIQDNVANYNGDYGIEAVPGVVDGGGNSAIGNGNPAQCLNVAC